MAQREARGLHLAGRSRGARFPQDCRLCGAQLRRGGEPEIPLLAVVELTVEPHPRWTRRRVRVLDTVAVMDGDLCRSGASAR